MKKLKVYGIGHSNLPIDKFIGKLKKHKIEVLVDIRSYPQSRWATQYNARLLQAELSKNSILYTFKGRNLGGKHANVDYDKAIGWLAELAKTKRAAVCCTELKYQLCHRHTVLTSSLKKLGVEMVEIE